MTKPKETTQGLSIATKVVLGWTDDDDAVLSGEIVGLAESELRRDATLNAFSPIAAALPEGGLVQFAGGISSWLWSQWPDFVAPPAVTRVLPGIGIFRHVLPGEVFGALPTARNFDPVRETGMEAVEFRSARDFHSTPLSELVDVELIIGSVKRAVLEVLDSLIHPGGSAGAHDARDVGDFADDRQPTGLAYSDDAADYPPAPRSYADVKVGIGDAGKAKPRRYTDEDHQVWGPSLDGA
jgi:hypothetical protein